MGLEQTATGRDLNFTDFTVKLGPAKSVLSAGTGSNIGYGGPRQTLLRISPTAPSVVVKGASLRVNNVPITPDGRRRGGVERAVRHRAAGAALAAGQVVGLLNVNTRWYA